VAAVHLAYDAAPQDLFESITTVPDAPYHPQFTRSHDGFLELVRPFVGSHRTAAEVWSAIGALALTTDGAPEALLRQFAADHLPTREWPTTPVHIPRIDAQSGTFGFFSRESSVPLVDAVAASCAVPGVWSPVTIGSRRYIDPIIRSPINADLALGHDHVIVIAPLPEIRGMPSIGLDQQIASAEASGKVLVIRPDDASRTFIGRDPQDLARRPAAARAGFRQAVRLHASIPAPWLG
jgi:NTE family protein